MTTLAEARRLGLITVRTRPLDPENTPVLTAQQRAEWEAVKALPFG
ncbi:hypothetical protein [Mycobacterium sp. 852013-51886_SCH5428379]|nr:hypothetical protein [Mycobacterium sp. 852013-51886_SCH5428379]